MTTRSLSEPQLRAIGRRVKSGRKRRKMSQYDLAIELRQRLPLSNKVSPAVISRIEAGAVEAGLDTIAALAVVLDLNLAEMAPEYVDDAARMHTVLTLVVDRGLRKGISTENHLGQSDGLLVDKTLMIQQSFGLLADVA